MNNDFRKFAVHHLGMNGLARSSQARSVVDRKYVLGSQWWRMAVNWFQGAS